MTKIGTAELRSTRSFICFEEKGHFYLGYCYMFHRHCDHRFGLSDLLYSYESPFLELAIIRC